MKSVKIFNLKNFRLYGIIVTMFTNSIILRFQFMLKCWELDPETRPTFSMLVKSLSKFLDSMAGYMDVSNIKGEDYSESIFSTSKEPIISNELKT